MLGRSETCAAPVAAAERTVAPAFRNSRRERGGVCIAAEGIYSFAVRVNCGCAADALEHRADAELSGRPCVAAPRSRDCKPGAATQGRPYTPIWFPARAAGVPARAGGPGIPAPSRRCRSAPPTRALQPRRDGLL